jgi:four helix bundle protein
MAGLHDYKELDVWQLADQVRVEINRICSSDEFRSHQRLRHQLLDAAESACANIAEGFARFYPKEHARFLRISRGSLAEVADRLRSAVLRGLVEEGEAARITVLTRRARGAASGLIRYLDPKS